MDRKKEVEKYNRIIRQIDEVHKATKGSSDPFKGWTELEVEAYRHYKPNEVEQSKLSRRLQKIKEKEVFAEKRAITDIQTGILFPESKNPNSHFSKVMDMKMEEYGLGNSPKGRLAAAKLAAAELEENPPSQIELPEVPEETQE